ncbi:KI20B protein, partial [Crypturellus undulatus]|nr:KI20B protein [Crypturellus undulatus]
MESGWDKEKNFRPSYIASVELPQRTGPVNVEDIKADLSDEFSLVSSSSDISQSKGHIQVCLRVRPFTSLEKENESQDCVSLEDSTSIVLKPPKNSLNRLSEKTAGQLIQKFTFSRVFGPETTQEEFFEGTMKQPVQDFLEGYNRLVFTYGVTNAGKTYTFQGTEDDVGILPRTMDMLFKNIQGKLYTAMDLKPHRCRDYIKLTKDQVREETAIKNSILRLTKEVRGLLHSLAVCNALYFLAGLKELVKESEQSSPSGENCMKFSVWVSFFEIYNESFYDLLIPISNDKKRKTLRLAQDVKGCSYIKDLQWIQVSDSKEAFRLLKLGLKHQSIASTKLNTTSSRSHSIFTIKVLKIEVLEAPRVMRVNELSLCDLAGSERCTKTRNEGERLKESGNINTSLLTLGKCINALKNSQQSKLQQHIPFRESKLTHFLQGFFSGRGKVYMIVNISQCASAYDETVNVLKFSAIAQKVLVLDSSILPQDQSFGQKSARDLSLGDTRIPITRKRATILWDRSLEDLIEGDDEMEEQQSMSGEETLRKYEENQVVIGKEEYMVCARSILRKNTLLSLIEDLKNKLIAEKKEKLMLELKIREEVTQEFTQYFGQREVDFKECLSRERERLEEDSERRLEIFKELVNGYTKGLDEEKLQDIPCNEQAGPPVFYFHSCSDLEVIIDSLQNDVIGIKKQAEAAHRYIASLEDPQEATGWFEKQLGKTTTELTRTKEELTNKTVELGKTREELTQKSRGELDISENSKEVTKSSQLKECEETVLEVGKKRCFENKPTVEEEPPTKKGTISTTTEQEIFQKNLIPRAKYTNTEIVALKGRTETLESQLAALEQQCKKEKTEKEELVKQVANLGFDLSASEERECGLREELQQCQANYQETVSELRKQKAINEEQEEKIVLLHKEIECTNQDIIDKVSQIKTMQSKIDDLCKCCLESHAMDVDLINIKDVLESQKDESETSQVGPLGVQSQAASTEDARRDSSFRCSIEGIWEECKKIIKASSQKSQQIQELLQQVENLNKDLADSENDNNQLKVKLSEFTNQATLSIKDEALVDQLQEQIRKKTEDSEKWAAEHNRAIAQFEEEASNYKGKIKELEYLLEGFRSKDDNRAKLEQVLKEKESIILNLESTAVVLQEECANSEKKLKELTDQEINLKDQVVQLKSSLEEMKHSLQEKEKNDKEKAQSIEVLSKELSERSALIQSLKKDLQRKDEEYTDLKEKFSDAKKQIQQVQKEVCTMRSEEKSLRKQVNELENTKKQLGGELDIKQRTIQQLKKEKTLGTKRRMLNCTFIIKYLDLCTKEKIIEDMRMTLEEQEQTQTEQEQVLEAKLEETNRLISELEEWKQKYRELMYQSKSDQLQKVYKEEKSINANTEESKLQEKLKESEEKYQTDRKKWVEEKMGLISQVKEAENHRNREMRKFAEDRECHVKQQAEIERLNAQLVEKDSNLQQWREERDKLVEALEIQLRTLTSNITQKDKEIAELKQATLNDSRKVSFAFYYPFMLQNTILAPPVLSTLGRSDIVLDSSEVSTENGRTSRFPKPEMEIQFTPLQPNKIEVKHQGSTLPVTVKMLNPRRKRKSEEMDEDFVKNENKKNAKSTATNSPSTSNKKMVWSCAMFMPTTHSFKREYSLRKQESASSTKSVRKKEGTLQKIGDFFQGSPAIIHSKAKKLIATISSPKSMEPESLKENEIKSKRAKRKLYSADISGPLDIPASSVKQKEKESDHLIIKRRLRSKMTK